MTSCSIAGCSSKIHAKSLCSKHYWEQKYYYNKNKKRKYQKTYYTKNRDAILARTIQYGREHKIEQKIRSRKHYLLHKNEIKEKRKIAIKIRRKNDPAYKLRCSVSLAVWKMLYNSSISKNGKSVLQFLPYSMEEFKFHLEKQFDPWMNWDNYGKYNSKTWIDNDPSTWVWNIDHIIPQSRLVYHSMSDENFTKCWSLSNLRPLSAKQNFLDKNRVDS
jgi:hypothetical protein